MASTWPAACSIEAMWSQRMPTLPSPQSRPRGQSSLLIGAQLDSRLVSITSPPLWSQGETLPRYKEQCACSPTPPPLLRLGPGLTTSLTSCTPRELLFTGTWERAWRRENSLRLGKTWLLWRRIMKRLAWTALRLKEREEKNTKYQR